MGKAKTTAVLLGDFMQLGPVLPRLDGDKRPDVARWIPREVFEHFGIESPTAAVQHSGCVVLDVQHRFGLDVMTLANSLAYDGVLKAEPGVEQRAARREAGDAEIVVVDTDGLQSWRRLTAPAAARAGGPPAPSLHGPLWICTVRTGKRRARTRLAAGERPAFAATHRFAGLYEASART